MKNDIVNIQQDDFLTFLQVKRRMGKNTIVGHRSRFRIIQSWFALQDSSLTTEQVERFYLHLQDKGLSAKGLNNYFHTFRMIALYLEDRGKPAPFLDTFKPFKEDETFIDPLTLEEIQLLIKVKAKRQYNSPLTRMNDELFKNVIIFLAYTGCRWSECVNLKAKYVDIQGRMVVFAEKTKTKKVRRVYISEPLLSILSQIVKKRSPEELVFQNSNKGPLHGPDFSRDLHNRARVAGITKRVNPHLFRHSYAQALYDETGDSYLVKEVLGHANITTTLKYVRLGEERIRNAQLSHPFLQEGIEPKYLIRRAEEQLKSIRFDTNNRFEYVKVVEAVNEFILGLHKSVKS